MGCCSTGGKEEFPKSISQAAIPTEETTIRRAESRILSHSLHRTLSDFCLDRVSLEEICNSSSLTSADFAVLETFKVGAKSADLRITVAYVLLTDLSPLDKSRILFSAFKTGKTLKRPELKSLISLILDISCKVLPLSSSPENSYMLEHYLTGLGVAEPIVASKSKRVLLGSQDSLTKVEFLTRMTEIRDLTSLLSSKTTRLLLWNEYRSPRNKQRAVPKKADLRCFTEPAETASPFRPSSQADLCSEGPERLVCVPQRPRDLSHHVNSATSSTEQFTVWYPWQVTAERHGLKLSKLDSFSLLNSKKSPRKEPSESNPLNVKHQLLHREKINGKIIEISFNSSDNLQQLSQRVALKHRLSLRQRREIASRLSKSVESFLKQLN